MNCWEILGIEPTVEIKTIKKAYAVKLRIHHPEDDPEGFNQLRVAYEEALNEAKVLKVVSVPVANTVIDPTDTKKQQSQAVVELPILEASGTDKHKILLATSKDELVGKFMDQITRIYNDFSLRINEKAWSELFESDIYWRIDLRIEIQHQLLSFLMMNYRLPHKIWQLFDEHFSWKEQRLTLYKEFPKEFIDFIISKIEKRSPEFSYAFLKSDANLDFDRFIDYREEAFYALRKRDLNLAKEFLDAANQIYANDPDLRRLLARYYCLTGQIERALDEYNQLLTINNQDLDAHFNRAVLLQRSDNYKAAISDYQWLLTKLPDDPKILSGLAYCYRKLGKFLEAKTLYEQIIEAYPYDVDALFQIASINYQLVAKYRQELQSDSNNNIKLRYQIANLLYELNEYEDCYEEIKTIKDEPDLDSATLLLIGKVICQLGRVDEGLKWINKALKCSYKEGGNGYQVLIERGNLLKQNKRYHKAIEDFLAAQKINSYNPELLYNLAESYRRIGLLPECIDYATRAIALKNDDWSYYSTRGIAYYYEGYYQEAKADHQIVVDHSNTFAEAWFRLAFCHLNLEEYEQAIDCFTTAWNYDNELNKTFLFKAYAFIKTNQPEAALQNINAYIDKEPNTVEGYIIKGYIHQMLGDLEQATREYCMGSEQFPESYLLAKTAFYSINQKGLLPESIKFLNRLIDLTPQDHLVQTMVAVTFMQLKDEAAALTIIADYCLAIKDYSQASQRDLISYLLNQAQVLNVQVSNLSNYQQRYQQLLNYLKSKYNFLSFEIEQHTVDEASIEFFKIMFNNHLNGFVDFANLSTTRNDLKGFLNWIELMVEMREYELALSTYYIMLNEVKTQTINFAEQKSILYLICQNALEYEWLLCERNKNTKALELITHFIECICSHDESFVVKVLAKAWNRKGIILERLKRYQEALECYDQAIKLEPYNLLYWKDKAEVLVKLDDLSESLESYYQLLKLAPHINELWRKTGMILMDLSNYLEALNCYNKALELDPYDSWTWVNKGVCLESLNQYDEVFDCYHNAVVYEPATILFWEYKIGLLIFLKRYDEALACSNKGLENHPNCSVILNIKGDIFKFSKKYHEALECYTDAITYADDDDNKEVYLTNKAQCLVYLEDYNTALPYFDQALELNPNYDNAWCGKGIAYYYLEAYEAALECFEAALKIDPNAPAYWNNKGEILQKLDRNEEAELCFDRVRAIDPNYVFE